MNTRILQEFSCLIGSLHKVISIKQHWLSALVGKRTIFLNGNNISIIIMLMKSLKENCVLFATESIFSSVQLTQVETDPYGVVIVSCPLSVLRERWKEKHYHVIDLSAIEKNAVFVRETEDK